MASDLVGNVISENGLKSHLRKFLIAGLTFVVGVSLSSNWVGPGRVLPYCELAKNADGYHGRTVRVRAHVSGEAPTIYTIFHSECDPVEALASRVEVAHAEVSSPEIRELWERLSGSRGDGAVRKAEVVLSGRFDGQFSNGCWGPKFKISEAKIERVISVSETRLPTFNPDEVPLRIRH